MGVDLRAGRATVPLGARVSAVCALLLLTAHGGRAESVAPEADRRPCLVFSGNWAAERARQVADDLTRAFDRRGLRRMPQRSGAGASTGCEAAPGGEESAGAAEPAPPSRLVLMAAEPTMATVTLSLASGSASGDQTRSRHLDLRRLPLDGRPLAIVVAADELVRAGPAGDREAERVEPGADVGPAQPGASAGARRADRRGGTRPRQSARPLEGAGDRGLARSATTAAADVADTGAGGAQPGEEPVDGAGGGAQDVTGGDSMRGNFRDSDEASAPAANTSGAAPGADPAAAGRASADVKPTGTTVAPGEPVPPVAVWKSPADDEVANRDPWAPAVRALLALERYGGGQTHVGPDVTALVPLAGPWYGGIGIGARRGVTVEGASGRIRSSVWSGRLAFGRFLSAGDGGRAVVMADAGVRAGRVGFVGVPDDALAAATTSAGWMLSADTMLAVSVRVSARASVVGAATAGVPLRAQRAAEGPREVTAAAGLVVGAQVGGELRF